MLILYLIVFISVIVSVYVTQASFPSRHRQSRFNAVQTVLAFDYVELAVFGDQDVSFWGTDRPIAKIIPTHNEMQFSIG